MKCSYLADEILDHDRANSRKVLLAITVEIAHNGLLLVLERPQALELPGAREIVLHHTEA